MMAGVRCASCNDAGCDRCRLSESARFHQILRELGELCDEKEADYAVTPFSNIRGSKEWGVEPWVGAMIRANDKMKRLQKFAREGKLANEPAVDSFRDLAVYAVIALVLYEEGADREEGGVATLRPVDELVGALRGDGCGPTPNPEFLEWVADRLVEVHCTSPHMDFVISLRKRAELIRSALETGR